MSTFSRRKFISTSMLASGSLMVPGFLKALDRELKRSKTVNNNKLIVVQLSGGNDGLNTIIPVRNDLYYKSRPRIGIKKNNALRLTDDYSLNSVMQSLNKVYDDGMLTVINGVGYPNPDFSHTRSREIWESGSSSNEYLNSGWIGRYLDANCKSEYKPHDAVQVDEFVGLVLRGKTATGISYRNTNVLSEKITNALAKDILTGADVKSTDDYLDYMYKSVRGSYSSFEYLSEHNKESIDSLLYPDTPLGSKLKRIAGFINGNAETKIYYASFSSFDTHTSQPGRHEALLTDLSDSLYGLIKDLKRTKKTEEVCILVFSEFGRRLEENGSAGTDHGTANSVFILGGKLKKQGIYNPIPSLSELYYGNLVHTIDFRSVYATLLNKWLGADDAVILKKQFPLLNFI